MPSEPLAELFNGHLIRIVIVDGKLCISGSCGNSRIENAAAGASPTIRLCARFVQEAIAAAPQDAIELEFSCEEAPMVIRASSYLALVMPMGR